MNIDLAISKLNDFKKMSKKLGECDLVGFNGNSFTVKIQFEEDKPERNRIVGFHPISKEQEKSNANA